MYRCNKKIKKILFLIVLIAICIFLKNSKVYAKSVQELQNEYPTGSVWTGGGECAGFAAEMYKQYYGISAYTYNEKGYSLDDIRPGTIVRYTGNMGHSVWITGRNGDTVTLGEANYDLANGIRWTTRPISYFSNLNFVYKAPYDIGATPPTISAPTNIKAEVTYSSGIHVTWNEVQHASDYEIKVYKEADVNKGNFNNPVYDKRTGYATTSHYFDFALEGNYYVFVHAFVGYNISPNGGTPAKITMKLIKSINISIERTTLVKGESIEPEITYSPADANNKLTITTSDKNIGEYKPSTGYISAKNAGTFDLIASASNGVTARKTITVIDGVPATNIILNKYSVTLKQGETFKIIPTVKPDNATIKQCTYVSRNESVATVNSNGVVTGVGVGKTYIYISAGNVGLSCNITVEEAEQLPTLAINKETYQLNSQNETFQLKATLSNGGNPSVTWSSSNSNIVSVSSTGLITAKKGGFAHVYAKSSTYGTVSCWVYVAVPVTLSTGEKRYVGDMNGDGVFDASDASCILDAYRYNPTADQLIIGDISGEGVVDAADASIIQDIFKTEVFKPGRYYHITEIKLNKTQVELAKGKTATLTATITPSNTTDSKKIKWSSSNSKIATVDSNGKINAVAGGTATVTAETSNGKKATCKVVVDNMPFVDVKSTDWFYNDVKYVYENKLITGYSDKIHFGPNDKITRAMVVTILYRMDGSPAVTGSSKFKDVKQNVWYSNAIKWATDKGIVHGYNSEKFGPNDNITRQDLMVILRNYAKYKKKDTNVTMDLSKYSDTNKIAPYAKSAVEWAVKKGILVGSNGKLNPQGTATRAEMAAFIHRYCTKIGK